MSERKHEYDPENEHRSPFHGGDKPKKPELSAAERKASSRKKMLENINPDEEHVSPLIDHKEVREKADFARKAVNTIMGDSDFLVVTDDDEPGTDYIELVDIKEITPEANFPVKWLEKGTYIVSFDKSGKQLYEFEVLKEGNSPTVKVLFGDHEGKIFTIADDHLTSGHKLNLKNGNKSETLPAFHRADINEEPQEYIILTDEREAA